MSGKSFSERMGFTQPKPVQIDNLDRDARMALYNAYKRVDKPWGSHAAYQCWQAVVTQFLKMKMWHANSDGYGVSGDANMRIERIFFECPWYESFDLIEFICPIWSHYLTERGRGNRIPLFTVAINQALEQENVGFRFLEGKFVPIQNKDEQESIERALDAPFVGAQNHIQQSLVLFSDRSKPDYANSIKESISAVESICKEITGKEKFSDAVNKLGIQMHPAFKEAAKKLYGFTSDEEGIRHAATRESLQVNQATARYMLIVCSAMVNFIIAQKSDAK